MRSRTITAMATLALAASVLGAHAQTTTTATPNGSHVLQGDFEAGGSPTFGAGNNSKRVGYGGGGGTTRCNQPIWGLDLPEIPAGESLSAATLSVDVPSISGAPLFFEVLASLMTATDVSEFAAAPDQYFVAETAPLDSVLANGIVFAQFAQADVPVGGTLEIPVTGAALAQLNSLYNAAGLPNQSTVWFRLSTSVTNDPSAWQGGDRIQFADNATESTWAAFALELDWGSVPVFIADPIVKATATWGLDYATLNETLAGSATNSAGSTMTYEKVDGPDWLEVAVTGELSGTPDVTGTNDFSIKAIGGDGSTIGNLQIVVDSLGNAPEFTTDPVVKADGVFNADYASLLQTLDGSADDDDGDTLIYSRAGGGPGWLNVASNGTLSGVCDVLGTNTFPVMVDDGNGNSDTASLVIFVPTIGNAPVFTSDPIIKVDGAFEEDYALLSQSLTNNATDPDGDTLIFLKSSGPDWLNVASNGTLSGVCGTIGTNSFNVTVDDGNGNSDTAELLINVSAPQQQAPDPDGLFAHWAMNEGAGATAADESANGYDGVIDGATWVTGGTGPRATYLSFDGVNDRVNPSLTLPLMTTSNDFTWAVWANNQLPLPLPSTQRNGIIIGNRKDGSNADFSPREFIKFTPNQFEWRPNDKADGTQYTDLPASNWVHLAVVKTGDNLQVYYNGVSANANTVGAFTNAMPFFIGGEPQQSASEHFNGWIDDVRLYDYALNTAEILYVMNDGGDADLSSEITEYSFDLSGSSSLSFQGAPISDYIIKSTGNLPFPGYTTVTPTAVLVGSLNGSVITTDATGAATAEFTETASAQFYKVESAP